MKRILIVTQYIYPETFKSNDIAFELAKRGYKVDVLTGIPNYPEGVYYKGYSLFKKRTETVDGVKFYRCFQSPRGKKAGTVGLSFNYVTFVISATLWVLFFFAWKKKYDAIITHEPSPITQIIPASILGKIRKTPVYSWIMDIWPDSILDSVGERTAKLLLPPLTAVTEWVYRHSDKIMITSKGMSKFINRKHDYSDKIIYFPNWSADLLENNGAVNGLPNLPEGFKIVAAGNMGGAQNLDAVAECIKELHDIPEVKWIFVGDGSERNWLDNYIKENNLDDVAFTLGRFPFSAMPYFSKNADAMLVTLRAGFPYLDVTVPARLQSYMSAGRPVLAMLGQGGIDVIRESDCGYAVASGDYKALANVIRNIVLKDRADFESKGKNGRKYFEKEFTLEGCIDNLEEIIKN